MPAPDLQQNIFYTIYFTWLHNFLAIFYFIGLILSIALSLYRPTRKATLMIVGFAALLFAFEYSKHIVDGLKEQTMNAVITTDPHYRFAHYLSITITKLTPLLLHLIGFSSLILAAILHFKEKRPKK